jgi:AbrB family transcriptional regulator (stage V sporulation protein T)
MKATGIIRRIDDLGRLVVPKEIRRTLGINEGDAFEIYTDKNGEVIFKKYDADLDELQELYDTISLSLYKLDVATALYWDGKKISGHPSLPNESNKVNVVTCGTSRTVDIEIGFAENYLTTVQAGAMELAAMIIKQKAIDLWDD